MRKGRLIPNCSMITGGGNRSRQSIGVPVAVAKRNRLMDRTKQNVRAHVCELRASAWFDYVVAKDIFY